MSVARNFRCAECGFDGVWLVDIFSRPWFKPNPHDDGRAYICNRCWIESYERPMASR